jgi:hypothetical protein
MRMGCLIVWVSKYKNKKEKERLWWRISFFLSL